MHYVIMYCALEECLKMALCLLEVCLELALRQRNLITY